MKFQHELSCRIAIIHLLEALARVDLDPLYLRQHHLNIFLINEERYLQSL